MNRPQPELSVIVPARNAERTLDLQLRALCEQQEAPMVEILVVDNGSNDDTALIAEGVAAGPLPSHVAELPA